MQISVLYQDLIKELASKITLEVLRDINLGDLLTARVKAVDGDTVLLRVQGRDIPAKTLIPLEIGETLTFQYQGIQEGKAFIRLVDNNLPQKESEFVARVLQSFDLPDTATNRVIINQMIRQQMPMDKKDVIQIGNLVKNLQIPAEDIEPAVFLFRQGIPPSPENINLLREFQSEGVNLFQGLNEIVKLVSSSQTLAPPLKDELNMLLTKLSTFQITTEDSGSEILTKLSLAPSFAVKQPGGQGQKIGPPEINPSPILANKTEIIITGNQNGSKQASTIDEIAIPKNDSGSSPALPLNRENLLSRLETLAGKYIGEQEKINLFLKNIRDTILPHKEEIQEMLNKISVQLDSAKPEEHALKEILKNISNRFDFVDQLVQRAPTDNNQQIVFYSQVLIKDNSNHERPVTITIKHAKEQKDKKINFNNCHLAISLQTKNLNLVKANVKKTAQKLTCQLIVDNEPAKNILDPVLPELKEALEKLNFNVTVKPVLLQTVSQKAPRPAAPDVSTNLLNIDIRI